MNQSQIQTTLRYLKQAVAALSNAKHAIADTGPATSANIDILLRSVLAEIRRIEKLYSPKN